MGRKADSEVKAPVVGMAEEGEKAGAKVAAEVAACRLWKKHQ